MSTPSAETEGSRRTTLALWFAVLGAPVAWYLNQQINLVLVPWVCATGRLFVLHLVSLACLVTAVLAGLVGWRAWRRARMAGMERGETTRSRERFMGVLGVMLSALFAVVIVAQDLPNFILDPCHR